MYRSSVSLVKLIPRNFIHFDAIANEIVFNLIISFLDYSLLVDRNIFIFYTLIFYIISLLN